METAPKKTATKPATKKVAKKTTKQAQVGFEESLWDAANKLRGSVESAEYKHIVLSLIFLKFISDKFEVRQKAIIAEHGDEYIDMVDFYAMDNVFYLPEDARWSYIQANAKQGDIAVKIDTALHGVEKNNKSLAGALPDNYFSRLGLDASKLSALIDTINNIDTIANQNEKTEEDLVGRVYEYFLGKFAASEGKGGGEFYTPKSIVTLIADMIEPFEGKIYDPCCGSGGIFVQSLKFINSHNGNQKNVSIYGQEYTNTTYKLAKMNLAVRGISGNLGDIAGDTFFKDQHPDLKADYIMANPPFNQKQWRADNELVDDARWAGYPTPPTGNANYAWIMHMISKLSEHGTAGFVLANGSMSSNTSGEGDIRQKIIENDLVDCMIALPGQLFYTTQIPVCLWFISKDKRGNNEKGLLKRRDRQGETLFIDAREMGSMVNRTLKELTNDDIAKITQTYHIWRGEELTTASTERESAGKEQSANKVQEYADIAGYCKSATLADIKANDYVLTPGRYVGAADIADDGIPFETKMSELSQTLYSQMNQADELDNAIRKNLQALGYGEERFGEKRDSEERND
ncbi:type I restriction-modification system subunit M [Pseudoalteromonas sp. 1_2015MBL_MicDiv]|uniref:type I restriction-modification system subunit M n=1 Tax=Pseudoalteromonas sp. 1_2015MBL_MicDiv TaxID=1720343 RepID=UPI000BBF1711|nr:class I SAM-dependent DNA methyltransferase [Pseudoalteromonas sp. 1_2015MBL_MicDiv]ATG79498.1 DNA methyltransferase [Pseudoalteromonas sp. 1_2015MBL_MicDiv]